MPVGQEKVKDGMIPAWLHHAGRAPRIRPRLPQYNLLPKFKPIATTDSGLKAFLAWSLNALMLFCNVAAYASLQQYGEGETESAWGGRLTHKLVRNVQDLDV